MTFLIFLWMAAWILGDYLGRSYQENKLPEPPKDEFLIAAEREVEELLS